jgi:mRNA-degrading endonuclease RelE of RelBE toxin-antitoxin system
MKPIVFTPAGARQWIKLAEQIRRRIDGRLTEFATSGKGDVKRLKGRQGSRLRVGDWRVIFYEESGSIVIVAVGHRREIYDQGETMNVRFQKTARGEVAILPRKAYETLVAKAAEADENAGTARLVAGARSKVAGGAPLLPKAVVDRLANGENPVRVLREWRDISQLYLSFKTKLSQGYISDVETGRRKGTAAALRRIADALEVPLDLLA